MRRARRLLSALIVAIALAAPAAVDAAPGVLATAASRAALPGDPSFVAQLSPGLRVYALRTPRGRDAGAYAHELAERPGVFATQVDSRMKAGALAGACADVPSANQSLALVNAVGAAAVSAPAVARQIAILDTGVDASTSELGGRVLPGFNAADGSGDTSDIDGHGTEVASVAAARAGRFQGISPTSRILPVKIYDSTTETSVAWAVRGIEEAVRRGARVVSLASSSPILDVPIGERDVLEQAITSAFAQGAITVVPAGNGGKRTATIPGSLTRALTVGSASAEGTRDAFSNYGPWIDLVSPGANLILPAPLSVCASGYGTAQGTSFSAAAVAGAAALIWSLRPALNAQQLFAVMRTGAVKDLSLPGHDDDSGFGLLDVATGVGSAEPLKQAREVDDDVHWLKQSPKKHVRYLNKVRRATIRSAVAVGSDPQDVYPVRLKRGQTLKLSGEAKGGVIAIAIWRPKTGAFDVGKGRTTHRIADSKGVTASPRASARATTTGTYYVSVEAPDLPDRDDPQTAEDTVDPQTTYTLTLTKPRPVRRRGSWSRADERELDSSGV